MDQGLVQRQAKLFAELILSQQGIDHRTAITLVGELMAFVVSGEIPSSESPRHDEPVKRVEEVKEEPKGHGKVLATPGQRCVCKACKAAVFEVVSPVYDREMGVNAFIKAYKGLTGVGLTRDMLDILRDGDGNVMIDCPVCKAVKTLPIVYGGEQPKGGTVELREGFGTVDPRELGV